MSAGRARLAALALAAVLAAAPPAGATPPDVAARLAVPEGRFTVGDPITLKLTVEHPPGAVFDYPDTTSIAGAASGPAGPAFMVEEVEPIEASPPLPGSTSWTIRIRPFAPGEIAIPALTLGYRLPASPEALAVVTEPVIIPILSVLSGPEEDAADIKGPWRLPREWWRITLYALLAAALAAAAFLAWRRYRRRRRPAPPADRPAAPAPGEPAWARAMRDLEALLASSLLAQGRVKEFHVVLSEIVKRFLGEQHRFDALDRTTAEVMADLLRLGVDGEVAGRTRRFLEACDLVKFAKHRPEIASIDETAGAARALIETGRPKADPGGGEVAA